MWYSLELGDGIEANAPTRQLLEFFPAYFLEAGQPEDMGIFSRYDLERNIVTAYFTPSAARLAEQFGATPCE